MPEWYDYDFLSSEDEADLDSEDLPPPCHLAQPHIPMDESHPAPNDKVKVRDTVARALLEMAKVLRSKYPFDNDLGLSALS